MLGGEWGELVLSNDSQVKRWKATFENTNDLNENKRGIDLKIRNLVFFTSLLDKI